MAEQITTNDLSHTVTTTDSEKECKPEGATEDSQPAVLLAIPPPAEYPWMYKGPALSMVLVLNCASYWFAASLGPLKSTIKKELNISNAQYGVIASSGNLVNTVVPFFSGIALDYYGTAWLSIGSSALILLGAITSGIGASVRSYGALVTGEVIVGLGSITVETAQLKSYTHWCHGSHLGLIYGLNHAFNRVIIIIAKATAIPIVTGTGSWVWVIWIPAFISAFVLVTNIGYVVFERRLPHEFRPRTGRQAAETYAGGFRLQLGKSWAAVLGLPAIFWVITLSQLLQTAATQTYVSLQADMLTVTRGAGLASAGFISAIGQVPVVVLSPVVGLFMDRFGHRMHLGPVSALLFILTFALTGWSQVNAVAVSVVMGLGLSTSLLPFTVSTPLLVPDHAYIGTAQGTYQAFINGGHVILVTASGAIQDLTPTGRHSYSNVLYFLIALKGLDVFLGLFYVVLDKYTLNSILTRSERRQAKHDSRVSAGEIFEEPGRLRRVQRGWTRAGLVVGVAMTVTAWAVLLVYAQDS